jgi:hypothetical protein
MSMSATMDVWNRRLAGFGRQQPVLLATPVVQVVSFAFPLKRKRAPNQGRSLNLDQGAPQTAADWISSITARRTDIHNASRLRLPSRDPFLIAGPYASRARGRANGPCAPKRVSQLQIELRTTT